MSEQKIYEVNPANLGFKGPLLLDGFLESCLQQHFFTPDGIFDDALKEVLWRSENTEAGTSDTAIYIGQALKPNPKYSNFRPAILISRGNWQREKLALNDREGMGESVYGRKIDRWRGSHTFNCLTKTFASVEILAHEIATYFECYGQLLAAQICLDELLVTAISAPQLLHEDNETYSVSVQINYSHHNRWSLESGRPKIRHIRPLITVQDYDGRWAPKTTLVDIDYS